MTRHRYQRREFSRRIFTVLNLTRQQRYLCSLLYLTSLTIVSLLPSSALPEDILFPGADKIIHILMYAGLAALLRWTLADRLRSPRKLLALILVTSAYGILLEILQHTITTRSFEWADALANTLGAIAGSCVQTIRQLIAPATPFSRDHFC